MPDDWAHLLRAATGAGDRFRITVFAKGDTAPVEHEFQYPYAVVGRGEGCDIVLPDAKVSFRHAYFQVIEGRVFCVDLASRNGIAWPDGPRKYGWVPPNVPIQIGPYRLQVIGEEAADRQSHDVACATSIRWSAIAARSDRCRKSTWNSITRRPSSRSGPSIGCSRCWAAVRSASCRFDSPAVSGVHCGLLLTRHGLWAIDLLGRGGTKVDGENVRAVPLESGNEISVATFQIGVFYEEPADLASAERLTDNAAESDTSMDDLESAFLQDVPLPETALSRSA